MSNPWKDLESTALRGSDEPLGLSVVVLVGEQVTTHRLPSQGVITIGRDATAHIRINHPSVSRKHAALHLGATLKLADLGSSNGTVVGQEKLTPNQAIDL